MSEPRDERPARGRRVPVWLEELGVGLFIAGPVLAGVALPGAAYIVAGGPSGTQYIVASIVAAVLLVAGGYVGVLNSLLGGLAGDREADALRALPVLGIARAADARPDDRVFVEGRVASVEGARIRAPLTGRECVWYAVRVAVIGQGPHGRSWRRSEALSERVRFDLVDEHGERLRIDPMGGHLEGGREIVEMARAGGPYAEGAASCLAAASVTLESDEDAEVVERVLREGDRVFAIGHVRRPEGYRGGSGVTLGGGESEGLTVTTRTREQHIASRSRGRTRSVAIGGLLALAVGLAVTAAIALRAL